jgi:hypothetical protein
MVTAGVIAALLGLVLGFLVGNRARDWCPHCGWRLTPDHCRNVPAADRTRELPGGAGDAGTAEQRGPNAGLGRGSRS